MESYADDDKWKVRKDDSTCNCSLKRSISQKSSASKSTFLRSFSMKSSSSSSSNSKSSLSRSSSQSHKCSDFARKCSGLAKEQRAKFYIMKRCVKMLVFWHKNGDS